MNKSRRQARTERKQAAKRKSQMRTLTYVVIGAVIVAALLIYAGQVRSPSVERDYSTANGDQVGSPGAPVTIVEYADFQCSHCYNSYLTTDGPLFENYINTGKVLLEYRPLNFLGPESQLSAEAAYCAADQGVFWQYRDVLYANYSTNNTGGYSESRLMDFASSLNMDIDAFSQCLSSGEKAAAIDQNVEAAVADEVSGTPSFLINGTLYPGEQPYSNLQAVIESILSGAN